MSTEWLPFIGGILTALVAGLVASTVQRHNEIVKRKAEARLSIYFSLLDLNQQYFWVLSAEMRGQKVPSDVIEKCWKISWELADKLRCCDSVEYIDEILEVLFSDVIPSARERSDKLEKLIDKYGKLVNPVYARTIQKISKENFCLLTGASELSNSAPGNFMAEPKNFMMLNKRE
ncbi:MAG: hypothetical protein D3905_04810 [Candidatus Electrothrix sp. AS4_5]|nr:hypothetical protein [Candidatus Electrothrix gigas]